MHNPEFLEQKKIQFEKDQAAFETLTPFQQRAAEKIAEKAFFFRKGLVTAGKTVIGLLETLFNVFIYLPYKFALRGVTLFAQGAVKSVKLGLAVSVGLGRGALALSRVALQAGEKLINFISRKGWRSNEENGKSGTRIARWAQVLETLSGKMSAWGKKIEISIDRKWDAFRERVKRVREKALHYVEYRVALGLYRGTQWLFNPRLPSGKPLFYWESVNKMVGLGLAAGGFFLLNYQIAKIAFIGKMMHLKLATSFMTDPASLAVRFFKQITLHPTLVAGVTAAKLTSLPVIAATRQALKSTPFTQGIAYQYNKRLNTKIEKKVRRAFVAAEKDKRLFRSSGRKFQKLRRTVSIYLRKKSLSFLSGMMKHMVETTSPEFYEVRIKRCKELKAEFKGAQTPANDQAPAAATPAAGIRRKP